MTFAAEMQRQGIHVGMGLPGRCVNCGEPWPCTAERRSRAALRADDGSRCSDSAPGREVAS